MKIRHELPMALVIGGYDPSGGAGVIADIRAMEQRGVLAQAAVTGNTFQTDLWFDAVEWSEAGALRQIEMLTARADFRALKIGLVPSFEFLKKVLDLLEILVPGVPVVWDPILSATAGFLFHSADGIGGDRHQEEQFCRQAVDLIKRTALTTPNLAEYEALFGKRGEEWCSPLGLPLLVKSVAERKGEIGDLLFSAAGVVPVWKRNIVGASKHGSGCVLSSLIAAGLARGESVEEAVLRSTPFFERFLLSSETKLGDWFCVSEEGDRNE